MENKNAKIGNTKIAFAVKDCVKHISEYGEQGDLAVHTLKLCVVPEIKTLPEMPYEDESEYLLPPKHSYIDTDECHVISEEPKKYYDFQMSAGAYLRHLGYKQTQIDKMTTSDLKGAIAKQYKKLKKEKAPLWVELPRGIEDSKKVVNDLIGYGFAIDKKTEDAASL